MHWFAIRRDGLPPHGNRPSSLFGRNNRGANCSGTSTRDVTLAKLRPTFFFNSFPQPWATGNTSQTVFAPTFFPPLFLSLFFLFIFLSICKPCIFISRSMRKWRIKHYFLIAIFFIASYFASAQTNATLNSTLPTYKIGVLFPDPVSVRASDPTLNDMIVASEVAISMAAANISRNNIIPGTVEQRRRKARHILFLFSFSFLMCCTPTNETNYKLRKLQTFS